MTEFKETIEELVKADVAGIEPLASNKEAIEANAEKLQWLNAFKEAHAEEKYYKEKSKEFTEAEKEKGILELFNAHYAFHFLHADDLTKLCDVFHETEWQNNFRKKEKEVKDSSDEESSEEEEEEEEMVEIISNTIINCEMTKIMLEKLKEPFIDFGFLFIWGGHGWGYGFDQDQQMRYCFRHTATYRAVFEQ